MKKFWQNFRKLNLNTILAPIYWELIDPENNRLTKSYELLHQLSPLILSNQGKGKLAGVITDKEHPTDKIIFDEYIFNISFELNDKYAKQPSEENPRGGGIYY